MDNTKPPVYIALIIDDIGNQLEPGRQFVQLPAPITLSILPHTPYARILANEGHQANKEIMLHLPMAATGFNKPGPGAIQIDMSEEELVRTLRINIAAVPHIVGINNHMGSLITQHPGHMAWLMTGILSYNELYFVDSVTSAASLALQSARTHQIPSTRRDIFLDHDRSAAAIEKQLVRLEKLAQKQGYALAIGHPYPATYSAIQSWLSTLKDKNIILLPASEYIRHTTQLR